MSSKKKVLFLTTLNVWTFSDSNSGTAGNQTLYHTLKGYSDAGYEVEVLTLFDIGAKKIVPYKNVCVRQARSLKLWKSILGTKKKLDKFINLFRKDKSTHKFEDNFEYIEPKRSNITFYYYWAFFGFIEALILNISFKADIIYGYEVYSTRPASWIGRLFGIPVISRFQGTELGFFLNDEKSFYKNRALVKGTKVQTDLIIMGNDGTSGDLVLEKLGINKEKVRYWVNGLTNKEQLLQKEKDKNYKKLLGLPEDAFIITTSNRFVDWKRVDRIITAVANVIKECPNTYLVAVGAGPEEAKLKRLVQKLNIEDHVIFTGSKPHDEAIWHIANCDLYTTLNISGNIGNSILEALALAIPVLTLRNGSVESVIKDGYNGILVDEENLRDIPKIIISLIKSPEVRAELSRNARNYAKQELLSWPERMNIEIKEAEELIRKRTFKKH